MIALVHPLRLLFIPTLLLALFAFAAPRFSPWLTPWSSLLTLLPILLSLLLMVLAGYFNSSRALLGSLLLGLLYATPAAVPQALAQPLFGLNLALVALYRERGMLNRWGLLRLGLIAAQAATLWALSHYQPERLAPLLTPLPSQPAGLPPALQLLGLGAAAALMLGLVWRRQQRIEASLAVTLAIGLWLQLGSLNPLERELLLILGLLLWTLTLLGHGHALAYRDELTGLPGRRALNDALLRQGKRYAVAMLDVDHFKGFNDRYGHDVGDQVLKLVASRLARVRGGRAYRYGGEEFSILLPGLSAEQALAPLEQVRIAIEQARLQLRAADRPQSARSGKARRGHGPANPRQVSVTISIGVSDSAVAQPMKAADQALYRAKRQGRNRVCS